MSNPENKHLSNFFVDTALWFFSIFVSCIPVLVKQFFDPAKELVELPFFSRILSDFNFVYAFLTGGVVLDIQVLLTMRENEYIKTKFIKFLAVFCMCFYFLAVIVYNIILLIDYNSINELLQKSKISGSIIEANKMVIVTTLILSFTIGFLHSIPTRKRNT